MSHSLGRLPPATLRHLEHAFPTSSIYTSLQALPGWEALFHGKEPAREILERWQRSSALASVLREGPRRHEVRAWLQRYLTPSRAHLYAAVPYERLLSLLGRPSLPSTVL